MITISVSFTPSALGAKPTSVQGIEDVITDSEEVLSHYVVACSDDSQDDVSAWENRKHWCSGKGVRDDPNCSKKQIKTVKQMGKGA